MRVRRTFAFVDVSGFTALTELKGDEDAVEVLTTFRSLLRDICGRRGVRIVKWLGDGAMLVCVETAPLVATVLELHYAWGPGANPGQTVSIRSGVTSGDVILMEGDDYVGHCVNVAARLCDLSRGGEALVQRSVLEDMPRWGHVAAHRDVELRGLEKPVPASSIHVLIEGKGHVRDPVCGLPLSRATAEESTEDLNGGEVLFCSAGCFDTWKRRPTSAMPAAPATAPQPH
jgi:class 3 adenylate cyclase/YHS domain-containing protein